MKKIYYCLLLVLQFSWGMEKFGLLQVDKVALKANTESYYDYGESGTVLKLYPKSANEETKPLLVFTMYETSGGCINKTFEKGVYEINGTKLIFYTHWNRGEKDYSAPQGDRIQIYRVENNGSIVFESGKLYIERYVRGYEQESGMKYLFQPPKTKDEKEALNTYIKAMQEQFGGTFVLGKEAKALRQEVKEALERDRKKQKKIWL